MNLYLLVIIAYSLLLAVLGLESLRRTRKSTDFLIAGRSLSGGALFVSLLAANIGAGSTVGAAGLGYKVGLSGWWWVGSAGLGSLVLGLTVGPKIWRLAKEHNFLTVGDFLERRFGGLVRYQIAIVIWLSSLIILASQLIAIAWILNVVAGIAKPLGCLIGGALATVYFTAGGLKGAIRINTIQLAVKLGGFMAALFVALAAIGGPAGFTVRLTQAIPEPAALTSFQQFARSGSDVLGYLIVLTPAFIISPGLIQKIFGARDESAVRRGVVGNALVLLAYSIVPVSLGMLARAQHPNLPNHEMALPVVMMELLPVWMGAVVLAAVFSAEVGTVDAVLLMLSSSLAQDVYRPLLRPEADDAQLLRVSRLVAVGAGAIGIWLALQLASIIQGLTIFYSLITAALAIPLVVGLYLPKFRQPEVALSIVVSVAGTILIFVGSGGKGWWGLPPVLLGVACGTVALGISAPFLRGGKAAVPASKF